MARSKILQLQHVAAAALDHEGIAPKLQTLSAAFVQDFPRLL
jgi:hypothetical protein